MTLASKPDWKIHYAAVYRAKSDRLRAITAIDGIELDQLVAIDEQKQLLISNTERFLSGKTANHVLLWGARGTGKSSLIKAILNKYSNQGLRLIEFFKKDLLYLPEIVDEIRNQAYFFIIFCDDFSFDKEDDSYVILKSVLEGSIESKPDNMLFYATSNRRHLLPETMSDNLHTEVTQDEIHYNDTIENKLSLADRFGLWISFYQVSLNEYYQIIDSYFPDYAGERKDLYVAARKFSMSRGGSRSGRTARQFYNHFNDSA